MRIELIDIGKRFGKQWVFKDINKIFEPGCRTCITGQNGSGKSTLLKIIAGYVGPNKGSLNRTSNGKEVEREKVFQQVAIAAPYLDVYTDLSPLETIKLQASFKPFVKTIEPQEMLEALGIGAAANKAVKDLSSGMKQRLLLSLAIFSDTEMLLLDEPTSNLDEKGVQLYTNAIASVNPQRSIIVCSNDPEREAAFCTDRLTLSL